MMESIKKYKKRIIVSLVTLVVLAAAAVGGYFGAGYYYAKQNVNYSEAEVKEIALADTAGEVISVHKELELEENVTKSEYEYEIEIKTAENRLAEMTISARTGIIEMDDDHSDFR